MHRVCAWCGEDLDEAGAEREVQQVITHGVCRTCAFHLFAQVGMPLSEYLDGLDLPVLVVDSEGTVQTANQQACELLQKDPAAFEGFKGGDVFECTYASLPGGCGRTVHCSGCTIRQAVMNTLHTGESLHRAPAFLNRETPDGVQRIQFLISTERVEGFCLLRIDAVGD